jgi:predicted DNA-binding transcriptional regulator YafY
VKRGADGGYRLDVRPVLPPIALTPGEAAALIASLVAVGACTSATARTALDKLPSALVAPSQSANKGPIIRAQALKPGFEPQLLRDRSLQVE